MSLAHNHLDNALVDREYTCRGNDRTALLEEDIDSSLVEEALYLLRSRTDLLAQRQIRRMFLRMLLRTLLLEMFSDVVGAERIFVLLVVRGMSSLATIPSRLHSTILSAPAPTKATGRGG